MDARSESSLSTAVGDRDCASAAASGISRKESVRQTVRISTSSDPESNSMSSQTLLRSSCDPEAQLLECPLCLSEMPSECFPKLTSCSHRSCHDCLKKYLNIEINESR